MKKRIISMLSFLILLSLFTLAYAEEEAEEASETRVIINETDSVYNNDGDTVFNNMGTVYNNDGIVYNNGGTVYNNGGVTYNNGGIVYLNAGEVFNNGGEVFKNGDKGIVHDFDVPFTDKAKEDISEAVEEKSEELPGYEITLAGDYEPFAYIDGFISYRGKLYIESKGRAVITLKPGVSLINSSATTGRCTMQSNGSIIFSDAQSDGTLTLKFKLDDPLITPGFGVYGEKQQVKIIAAECAEVYYTLDGTEANEYGIPYTEPFTVDSSCTVSAAAIAEGAESGRTTGQFIFPKLTSPTFKAVNAGYSSVEPQPIVIENTGVERLWVKSARLTGTAADCFTLTGENGGRVSPGQKESKTWLVSPVDGLKAGIYYASVEFTFTAGGTAEVPIVFTVR